MGFLKDDQAKAQQEMDCYHYCIRLSREYMFDGDYSKSSAYLNNARRSLEELERMQGSKQKIDEWLRVKQIEGRQQTKEMMSETRLCR